jgi:outer membrane lipoprotein SlyB
VQFGVVEAVSPVTIEGRRSGVGALPGALIGGIAGSEVGGGKGKAISTVVGAVIGGIAGQALEEQATRAQGLEITVRMDHGGFISVVQEVSQEGALRAGDRVRLLRNGDSTRVAYWPYQNYAPDRLQ